MHRQRVVDGSSVHTPPARPWELPRDRPKLKPMPIASDQGETRDVIVLGAGPAGSTAALCLARAGHRVLMVDKARFPRFHVGESLIPQDMEMFADLGLLEEMGKLPQVRKRGVEFALGDGSAKHRIRFAQSLVPGIEETFNVERAVLDEALRVAAVRAGAESWQDARVDQILRLDDGDVALRLDDGRELAARYLIDASGQASVVGRHLKSRQNFDQPQYQKLAYFGHYQHVDRDNPLGDDDITMVLCDEGWFWMIPIDDTRVSIGLVLDAAAARQVKRPAHTMLAWGIERCPLIRQRVRHATPPPRNHVISDYSYRCRPYAGPGYFLIGDAATFLDPVFSTGIYLGMEGGREAARQIGLLLEARTTPAAARQRYERFLTTGIRPFFRIIHAYYHPAFRDLFFNGQGPLAMHRAVISILSGRVFPRPAWAVRWRMRLFYACVALQRRLPLVPRRAGFSLLATPPEPGPASAPLPADSVNATENARPAAAASRPAMANV